MQEYVGVLEDVRSVEEKAKDFSSQEVTFAGALNWQNRPLSVVLAETINAPVWSQNGSSACVAFAFARAISYEVFRITGVWIDFSPAFIYQKRANRPALGMYLPNAAYIVSKEGVTLDALMKSQNLTEDQISTVKSSVVANIFASGIAEAVNSYLYTATTVEGIAQAQEAGHALVLNIYANFDEYGDIPRIIHTSLSPFDAQIRHAICAIPKGYSLSPDLGKVAYADDSWGVGHGQGGRRILTEEFLAKRMGTGIYFDAFSFNPGSSVTVNIAFPLSYGMTNDEVKKLQRFLIEKGYFPANQNTTGFYHNITARAVKQWHSDNWQKFFAIDPQWTKERLEALEGKNFGKLSIQVAKTA